MTKFNDFIKEIKKFKENEDYQLSNDGKKYIIHSEELKKSLRKVLSEWTGALEVDSKGGENVTKHKLKQGNQLGLYQEKTNGSDEFILISDQKEKASTVNSPTPSQAPKAPTPIGQKPEGDYTSRKFRKDEKTGQRSWEIEQKKTGQINEKQKNEQKQSSFWSEANKKIVIFSFLTVTIIAGLLIYFFAKKRRSRV